MLNPNNYDSAAAAASDASSGNWLDRVRRRPVLLILGVLCLIAISSLLFSMTFVSSLPAHNGSDGAPRIGPAGSSSSSLPRVDANLAVRILSSSNGAACVVPTGRESACLNGGTCTDSVIDLASISVNLRAATPTALAPGNGGFDATYSMTPPTSLCLCTPQWEGANCQIRRLPLIGSENADCGCKNGGRCVRSSAGAGGVSGFTYCQCVLGYSGITCSHRPLLAPAPPVGTPYTPPLSPPVDSIGINSRTPPPPAPAPVPAPPAPTSGGGGNGLPVSINDAKWAPHAERVKNAMAHAWKSYSSKCFGQDELETLSGVCSNWMRLGLTIVDSLDTLWIMDLKSEWEQGKNWVRDHNFSPAANNMHISFFETTIRILGGLLSAFDLSGDRMFLTKSQEMGTGLAKAFATPTGIPHASVNPSIGAGTNPGWTGGSSVLSEIGTVQLEFTYLSQHISDPSFARQSQRVIEWVYTSKPQIAGLYPIFINPSTGSFTSNQITWGAMGDSLYEYFLKMWLLTGQSKGVGLHPTKPATDAGASSPHLYRGLYEQSTEQMRKYLLQKDGEGLYYVADRTGEGTHNVQHKMDHLVCFVPGMLALGASSGILSSQQLEKEHMALAKELMKTCFMMYDKQPTKLAPEFATFSAAGSLQPGSDAGYKLRPETVESLYILHRLTGDEIYRQWGVQIFNALEAHCRTPQGYVGLRDIRNPRDKLNKQESYMMAETFKYLYLLFSPSAMIPLDKYVFNTECHPLTPLAPIQLHTVTA